MNGEVDQGVLATRGLAVESLMAEKAAERMENLIVERLKSHYNK